MKYSIFSAQGTEKLLEWGAAHAVRHGLRFSCVRGVGRAPSGICPPSVCLSQKSDGKIRFFEAQKSFNLLIGTSKRRVFACKNICELHCFRARQGQRQFPESVRFSGRMAAPCEGNFACHLGRKPVQKGGPPLAGGQGKAPRAENDTKMAPMTPPKAPSRPVRRLEK